MHRGQRGDAPFPEPVEGAEGAAADGGGQPLYRRGFGAAGGRAIGLGVRAMRSPSLWMRISSLEAPTARPVTVISCTPCGRLGWRRCTQCAAASMASPRLAWIIM